MFRLMGILTGSALAIGALIVTIGVPQFNVSQADVQDRSKQDLERRLPVEIEANPELSPQLHMDDLRDAVSPGSASSLLAEGKFEQPPQPAVDVVDDADSAKPPLATLDVSPDAAPDIVPAETDAAAASAKTATRQWFAFWSPFRSEIAANGFVTQLQQSTGLDYRVVKLKPGAYEVAFAYSDDADIRSKLEQISSATGLDLTGG